MVGLGYLPAFVEESTAYAVSADGSVVVGVSNSIDNYEAFLWTAEEGLRPLFDILTTDLGLDLTGWTLTRAKDISADGLTIVGIGRNPDGNPEAWVATLPEPGMLTVLALGAPVLLRRHAY